MILDPSTRRMLKVQAGDNEAYAELVREYQSRVVGLLFHLIGDRQEAEDLAQETFLRVYRARANYAPTAKFSTWLFTIVNNLARNAVRDRKRRKERRAGDVGGPDELPLENSAVAPSGAMPSRIFAKGELGEVVRAAIEQLSEDQRLAMMLSKFEHMNYAQIGDVMDRSEAAVKSLLSRARMVLRDILAPYMQMNPGEAHLSTAEEGDHDG
jgi:RNA polymerase sigma-70 factor (ECF subfamily)